MSARSRSDRDRRRRELGQNFLADRSVVERLVANASVGPNDLVVDLGAGDGALTLPLLRTGATVWAVERDPDWAERLRRRVRAGGAADRCRIIETDIGRFRPPRVPYRVIANPPFGATTAILAALLDRPERGPWRADLVVQREVAEKHSTLPPATLRTAAWSPWWDFRLGEVVGRDAFRPRPSVDAAVLTVVRRDPSVLPVHLAPRLRELLRPGWDG